MIEDSIVEKEEIKEYTVEKEEIEEYFAEKEEIVQIDSSISSFFCISIFHLFFFQNRSFLKIEEKRRDGRY